MIGLETSFLIWAGTVVLFFGLFMLKLKDWVINGLFMIMIIMTLLFLVRLAIWVIMWVKI